MQIEEFCSKFYVQVGSRFWLVAGAGAGVVVYKLWGMCHSRSCSLEKILEPF